MSRVSPQRVSLTVLMECGAHTFQSSSMSMLGLMVTSLTTCLYRRAYPISRGLTLRCLRDPRVTMITRSRDKCFSLKISRSTRHTHFPPYALCITATRTTVHWVPNSNAFSFQLSSDEQVQVLKYNSRLRFNDSICVQSTYCSTGRCYMLYRDSARSHILYG